MQPKTKFILVFSLLHSLFLEDARESYMDHLREKLTIEKDFSIFIAYSLNYSPN